MKEPYEKGARATRKGASMKTYLFGLAVSLALAVGMPAARAQDGVPRLDHVFVIVLENHNSFTSFGSIGILDNPQAPQIRALAQKYNVAPNYHGVTLYFCASARICGACGLSRMPMLPKL